jgi:hypothetical protein
VRKNGQSQLTLPHPAGISVVEGKSSGVSTMVVAAVAAGAERQPGYGRYDQVDWTLAGSLAGQPRANTLAIPKFGAAQTDWRSSR